jgi:hypothetical protein
MLGNQIGLVQLGETSLIAGEKKLAFSSSNIAMEFVNIPEELNNRLYAIRKLKSSRGNILALAGNSSKVIISSFTNHAAEQKLTVKNKLNMLKVINLMYHEDLHFVKINDIALIPDSSYFLASADNTTIAKIDYTAVEGNQRRVLIKGTLGEGLKGDTDPKNIDFPIFYLSHHSDYIFKVAASA